MKLMAGLQSLVKRRREGEEDKDDENSGRFSKTLFHKRKGKRMAGPHTNEPHQAEIQREEGRKRKKMFTENKH